MNLSVLELVVCCLSNCNISTCHISFLALYIAQPLLCTLKSETFITDGLLMSLELGNLVVLLQDECEEFLGAQNWLAHFDATLHILLPVCFITLLGHFPPHRTN